MLETAPTAFPSQNTHFLLSASHGHLEVKVDVKNTANNIVAIVCHPHPLHLGTMENKVVTTTTRALAGIGIPAVRFNYRGVGKSTGAYADTDGETEDLLTVFAWIQQLLPHSKILLAGFSFGAYIALRGSFTIKPERMLAIAPAIPHHADYEQLAAKVNCPYWVLIGEQDELVSVADVEKWQQAINSPKNFTIMPAASHFFHGKLLELRQYIEQWSILR